jgi:hypothetical protein
MSNPITPYRPQSIDDLMRLAQIYYLGGMGGKDAGRAETIAARIAIGAEVGLSPGAAVQSICIINGRATMFGDAPLALIRGSGTLEWITEEIAGEGDNRKATCRMKRRGDDRIYEGSFSLGDARRGGLLMKGGKPGLWEAYPDRMLKFRARSWAARDGWGDVLMGIVAGEEFDDEGPIQAAAVVVDRSPRTLTATAMDLPAIAAPAVEPPPADLVTNDQLMAIAKAKGDWLAAKGVDPADKAACNAAWLRLLEDELNVATARGITQGQADSLLESLRVHAADLRRQRESSEEKFSFE